MVSVLVMIAAITAVIAIGRALRGPASPPVSEPDAPLAPVNLAGLRETSFSAGSAPSSRVRQGVLSRNLALDVDRHEDGRIRIRPKNQGVDWNKWDVSEKSLELAGIHHRKSAAIVFAQTAARKGAASISLMREPSNAYDSNAIAVKGNGVLIGYVPRYQAMDLAPLMDADSDEVNFDLNYIWLSADGEFVKIALDILRPVAIVNAQKAQERAQKAQARAQRAEQERAQIAAEDAKLDLRIDNIKLYPTFTLLAAAAKADGKMLKSEREAFMRHVEALAGRLGATFDAESVERQFRSWKPSEADTLNALAQLVKTSDEDKRALVAAIEAIIGADGKIQEGESAFLDLVRSALRIPAANAEAS